MALACESKMHHYSNAAAEVVFDAGQEGTPG